MLTQAENELLTQTNAGSPTNEYFRRYWLPALLASELPEPDCRPVRVRILGEDLIAFHDSSAASGLSKSSANIAAPVSSWGTLKCCGASGCLLTFRPTS